MEMQRTNRRAAVGHRGKRLALGRSSRALIAGSALMAAAPLAWAAEQIVTTGATDNATIQSTGARTGANGKNFWNLEADGNGSNFASFGIIDFGQINIGNNVANAINGLTLTLWDAPASFSSTSNVLVNFYLTTDNTTNIQPGTTAYKDFIGVTPQGVSNTQLANLSFLGSGTYIKTASGGIGNSFAYSLTNTAAFSTNSASGQFLLNQINNFGTVRLVATIDVSQRGSQAATYAGFSNGTAGGTLTLDLDSTALPSNDSQLYVGSPGVTTTPTIDLGRVIKGVNSGPATVTLGNSGTGAANFIMLGGGQTYGSVPPGGVPLAGNSTTTLSAGLNALTTGGAAAGNTVSGVLTVQDNSNTNSTNVTVNLQGTVIANRTVQNAELAQGSGTNTTDFGKVLVGKTFTNVVNLTTQNLSDHSTNTLTQLTLSGTATGNFNGTLGVINATNIGGTTIFTNDEAATVRASVKATKSGQTAFGTAANFVDFTGTNGLTGEGIFNEVDHARVYLQWTGYAGASLSGTTSTSATYAGGVGTNGSLIVRNAPANDNGSNSLRLGAQITGPLSMTAQAGFTVNPGLGSGVLIGAPGTSTATTVSTTYSFDGANKLNGTYRGTVSFTAQNDDGGLGVQGLAPNDLGTITAPLTANVTGNSGTGTANILANGSFAGYFINRGSGSNSTVSFLGGSASAGTDLTVNWATPVTTRAASDKTTLGGSGTNRYAVQISYNPAITDNTPVLAIATGTGIVNATFGNSDGGASASEVKGAYDSNLTLGHYGIDRTNHVVWAVLDRPGTLLAYSRAFGDTNSDGQIDKNDIRPLATSGFFNDGLTTHTWSQGDFNGDGMFDKNDIRPVATGGLYNAGPYDPAGASGAAPAISTPTLTGRSAEPATTSAPTFIYNPSTGDVTVTTNGNGGVVELDLISAGNKFITANSKLASSGYQFITNTTHEQDGFTPFGSFVADGFDMGNILPAGLTDQQIASDLTAFYSATGNVNGAPANVTTPEPAALALLGLGAAGMLARRRRRR